MSTPLPKDVSDLIVTTTLALRGMPTERDSFACPYRGTISYSSLRIDEAAAAVERATFDRNRRRHLRVPLAASRSEIDLLAALWFYGEKPELQYQVGRYDLDFFWPDYRAAVEVDGTQYHDPKRDKQRDTRVLQHGILTVRVDAKHVHHDPLWAARHVCQTIVQLRRETPCRTS